MYHETQVEFTIDSEKGKPKKQRETYLVDAMSCTEAEANITSYLRKRGENEFEVKSTKVSKIKTIIMREPIPQNK